MQHFLAKLLGNGAHTHFIDYLAEVNAGISAVALLPQLFLLMRGRSSGGLSPLTFFLIAANSCIWLVYGAHRRAPPLIISSALNFAASVGILFFICIGR